MKTLIFVYAFGQKKIKCLTTKKFKFGQNKKKKVGILSFLQFNDTVLWPW